LKKCNVRKKLPLLKKKEEIKPPITEFLIPSPPPLPQSIKKDLKTKQSEKKLNELIEEEVDKRSKLRQQQEKERLQMERAEQETRRLEPPRPPPLPKSIKNEVKTKESEKKLQELIEEEVDKRSRLRQQQEEKERLQMEKAEQETRRQPKKGKDIVYEEPKKDKLKEYLENFFKDTSTIKLKLEVNKKPLIESVKKYNKIFEDILAMNDNRLSGENPFKNFRENDTREEYIKFIKEKVIKKNITLLDDVLKQILSRERDQKRKKEKEEIEAKKSTEQKEKERIEREEKKKRDNEERLIRAKQMREQEERARKIEYDVLKSLRQARSGETIVLNRFGEVVKKMMMMIVLIEPVMIYKEI